MLERLSLASRSSHSRDHSDAESDADVSHKTDKIRSMLSSALLSNVLVQSMERPAVEEVVELMWQDSLLAGQHLVDEGDLGDKVYVLEKGELQVEHRSKRGSRPVSARTMGPGALVCEMALLHEGPVPATIVCMTDVTFWVIEGAVFRNAMQEAARRRLGDHQEILSRLPFFKTLDREDIARMADAIQVQTFSDGETILKVGDPEMSLFVVESGSVRSTREVRHVAGAIAPKTPEPLSEPRTLSRGTALTRSGTFSASQANLLRTLESLGDLSSEPERAETTMTSTEQLKRGDYFGEISIIARTASEAGYIAVGPTRLLVISKEALTDLVDITSIEEIVRSTLRHRRKIAPLKSPTMPGRVFGIGAKAPLPPLLAPQ